MIQETTILQNNFVRPGDRLVFYSLETVRKLAVSVGNRRFFVPLGHPSVFRRLHDTSTKSCHLHELVSASTKFPLTIELTESRNYVNFEEDLLPKQTALKAEVRSDEEYLMYAQKLRAYSRSLYSTGIANEMKGFFVACIYGLHGARYLTCDKKTTSSRRLYA